MNVSDKLKTWYAQHHRELPWRETRDPYKIWLSEVILQQTRVEQGTAYYHRFVNRFPTVTDLAEASEDEVLKLWQGLGYYSRARNLHAAAQAVVDVYKGHFPDHYDGILGLKGVGAYTAAAIASIAFGLPHAVVDGNVYRVLARLFNVDTPIDSTAGKKQFALLAHELLDPDHAGDHNQAMMELGALVCTPRQPACATCPVHDVCEARKTGTIDQLPVKAKKTKVRDRYFQYIVVRNKAAAGKVWMQKRTGPGIWQNLYEFPLIETAAAPNLDALLNATDWQQLVGAGQPTVIKVSDTYKHILSHQRIHARFWEVEIETITDPPPGCFAISASEVHNYAIPKLIDNYLTDVEWS